MTVNGTNFETIAANDNLRVNLSPVQVSTATATALQSTLPPSATTGRVSVATPNGSAVSSSYLWVAPPPYLVTDLDSTGTLPFATGTTVSVAAGSANKMALRVFEGTEGHRASINVVGVTTGNNVFVYLFDPFGTVLTSQLVGGNGFVDTADLRSTATYSVVFDPSPTTLTAGTLTLYDVPPDFTSPVSLGSGVLVETTVPGQNGRLTFTGTAGHRLSVNQEGGYNCLTATTWILAPDGSPVGASTCGGTFMDTRTLTATGTYAILVDPIGAVYGSTTVTPYDVPADFTGTIPFSTPTVVTTTVPGQNGIVTFTGPSISASH
jgi:hypothetical protein